MASELLCMSAKKGSRYCGESKVNGRVDNFDCQSCNSCSSKDAGKSCPQVISGILCHSGSCIQEDLLKKTNATHWNAGNTCSNIDHATCDVAHLQQNLTRHEGNSLQDLCMQDHYDDEDEDDSDWEPVNHFYIKKWFCTNCTLPNFDDVSHCDVWYFPSSLLVISQFTNALALIDWP